MRCKLKKNAKGVNSDKAAKPQNETAAVSGKQSVRKACMTCGQEYADAPDKCPFDGTVLSVIATELAPGTILGGRYEIIAAMAAGGMGQIYKAKHKLMNRVVAIKTIHMSLVSSGAVLQRFQQEAQAISTLNHPNILTVFDFFISDDGQPYLVMDFLQGTNLQEVLKSEGRLDLSRALPILIAACSGFQHAHEHGVIHRDIKPANLMLVNFGGNIDFVKIVDFGIAKVVPADGEARHLTATGDTFGSPEFMSPEQCRAKSPDARSDVYSLGCVMYQALTGCSAFVSHDPMEIMYKQVHDLPTLPSEVCPAANLPKAVDALVMKAIQKDPADRFQTMDEMRAALEAVYVTLGGTVTKAVKGPAFGEGSSGGIMNFPTTKKLAVSDKFPLPDVAASKKPDGVRTAAGSDAPAGSTAAAGSTANAPSTASANSAVSAESAVTAAPTAAFDAGSSDSVAAGNRMVMIIGGVGIGIGVIVIGALNFGSGKQAPQNSPPPASSQRSAFLRQTQPPGTSATTSATTTGTSGWQLFGPPAPPDVYPNPAEPGAQPLSQIAAQPARPPVPIDPRIQKLQQAQATYQWNFDSGKKSFNQHHFGEARIYFTSAHSAAATFGQQDSRYIDSLYWISKCDLSSGQYSQAAQGFHYVLYVQKMRYGAKSAQVRATENDLDIANRALKH